MTGIASLLKCTDPACLCRKAPVHSPNIPALTRDVARLAKGQKVRVTFTDGIDATGTLVGVSILRPDDQSLWLDSRTAYRPIRHSDGTPGPGIRTIDAWDDDARFDRLMSDAEDYLQLYREALHCPASEKGWRELKVAEAKEAFLAEWMRGQA